MGDGRRKRRRMKQMQGLLALARMDGARAAHARARRLNVVLQPQQLQLAYSAPEDQDMQHVLGRVDLRAAKLEQVPDGFVIHETGTAGSKKVKLQDKDKATTDAWFFAVYTTISEFERMPILATEDVGHKFSAVVSASLRDEATEVVEFELSCQLVLPLRPVEKPSIKWKVWKTFAELQAFDDELRVSYGNMMKRVTFPRDRKRDSLFGGMRKKSLQELKEQQLALYVENVFQIPELSFDPVLVEKVKQFLGFDSFFEIVSPPDEPVATEEDPSVSPTFEVANNVDEPVQVEPEVVTIEPEANTQTLERQGSSTSNGTALLTRRRSSLAFEDEGEEFVEVVPETDPKEAKRLHKKVIQSVRELVAFDEERVQDFQDQTKDFGRDKMSATEYCSFLLGAVGAQECLKLIPLMARILPDEEKRNQLLAARAAIWRRAHRRHRRRSKQYSETVVLQQQKAELHKIESMNSRMRPKSEGVNAMTWAAERDPIQAPSRSSMIETRSTPSENTEKMRKSEGEVSGPYFRPGLFDARRKLDKRPSFNMFGENIQPEPINEENPADNESDDDTGDYGTRPNAVDPSSTLSRKLSLSGAAWTRPRQNNSFLDEDDDDDSSIGAGSVRSRGSSNYHSGRTVATTGSFRRAKSRDGSARLQRHGSRLSSSFIEDNQEIDHANKADSVRNDDDDLNGEEDSHTRFQKNRRRASRKFDAEAGASSSPVEENPVLARLKKQGAVNFMMR